MNATTHSNLEFQLNTNRDSGNTMARDDSRPHLAVQILAVIMLGIVSIVAVAMAFDATWVAGVAVIALLFPLWMKSPAFSGSGKSHRHQRAKVEEVAPQAPTTHSTGNASFDAYRSDVLKRLEQESADFERFLTRLRDARDAQEFDNFMDARALKAKDRTAEIDLNSKDSVGY